MQSLLLEDDSYTVTCAAQARVGGKICALTVMDVFLADDDEDDAGGVEDIIGGGVKKDDEET